MVPGELGQDVPLITLELLVTDVAHGDVEHHRHVARGTRVPCLPQGGESREHQGDQ
jgi:hypothetical protein